MNQEVHTLLSSALKDTELNVVFVHDHILDHLKALGVVDVEEEEIKPQLMWLIVGLLRSRGSSRAALRDWLFCILRNP